MIPHGYYKHWMKTVANVDKLTSVQNLFAPFGICDDCSNFSYIFDGTLLVPLVIYLYDFY